MNLDKFFSKLIEITGSEENVKDILIPCFQKLVMRPRFHLLSLLKVMFSNIEKNNIDNYDIELLENLIEKSKNWIFSRENINFTKKYWPEPSPENNYNPVYKIPEHIRNLFRDKKLDIDELLSRYISPNDSQLIEDYICAYIQEWMLPNKSREYNEKNISTVKENDKRFVLGFNDRQNVSLFSSGISSGIIDDTTGKLTHSQNKIDLEYKKGMDEYVKADRERFNKIFEEFKVSPEDSAMISKLWYGDAYNININSNNIVNICFKNKIKFKIPPIETSKGRLIIQTYITGIILGKNVKDIYDVCSKIDIEIIPDLIYSDLTLKPTAKVTDIINKIINKLVLEPKEMILRENWKKMINPEINNEKLIKYINKTKKLSSDEKYKIIENIKDINKYQSVTKYADSVYKAINKISNTSNITDRILKKYIE